MKTEAELRRILEVYKRFMGQPKPCICPDCVGNQVTVGLLQWILDGNDKLDRAYEEVAAEVARR